MTQFFAAGLTLVVLYSVLDLAARQGSKLTGIVGTVGKFIDHLVDPALPLIDYPPGDPRRAGRTKDTRVPRRR
jgi:hypothetical protein